MTVSLADINVVPNKQKYVEEGRAQADKLDKLLKRGMLTPPEWERHFSKLWADIKDEIGDAVMKSLPRKNPIQVPVVPTSRSNSWPACVV